jgi:hypothetical protein
VSPIACCVFFFVHVLAFEKWNPYLKKQNKNCVFQGKKKKHQNENDAGTVATIAPVLASDTIMVPTPMSKDAGSQG